MTHDAVATWDAIAETVTLRLLPWFFAQPDLRDRLLAHGRAIDALREENHTPPAPEATSAPAQTPGEASWMQTQQLPCSAMRILSRKGGIVSVQTCRLPARHAGDCDLRPVAPARDEPKWEQCPVEWPAFWRDVGIHVTAHCTLPRGHRGGCVGAPGLEAYASARDAQG